VSPPEEITWVAAQGFMTGVFRVSNRTSNPCSPSAIADILKVWLRVYLGSYDSCPTPPLRLLRTKSARVSRDTTPSTPIHLLSRLSPLTTIPPPSGGFLQLDIPRVPCLPWSDAAVQGLPASCGYDSGWLYLARETRDGIYRAGETDQTCGASGG
jgi:hypothetical protein